MTTPERTPEFSYCVAVKSKSGTVQHRLFDAHNVVPLKAGLAMRFRMLYEPMSEADQKKFATEWNSAHLPKISKAADEPTYEEWAAADKWLAQRESEATTEQRAGFKSLVRSAIVAEYDEGMTQNAPMMTEFFNVLDAYGLDPRKPLAFTSGRAEAGMEMLPDIVSLYRLNEDGMAEIEPAAEFDGAEVTTGPAPEDEGNEPPSEPEPSSPEPEPEPAPEPQPEPEPQADEQPAADPEPSQISVTSDEALIAWLTATYHMARETLMALGVNPDA